MLTLVNPNTEVSAELRSRIDAFVAHADQVTAEYWEQMGFTYAPPRIHEAEYLSDKWCRINTVNIEHNGDRSSGSVYGFICLQDNETRALGVTRAGDIHKAATYSRPAKHARGSVWAEDFNRCATAHGIVYMK
jgi:hypothetical protein